MRDGDPTASVNFIDLFAGAGGFSLGLRAAGADPRSVAIEADPDCAETLSLNLPESTLLHSDICEVSYDDLEADLVVAGPPCQGFSTLNRERRRDPRNLLYAE